VVAVVLLLAQSVSARAMVYRVSLPSQPDSFVVGTMHSEDTRVTAVLDEIEPLLAQVDIVALELIPDALSTLAITAATLLPGDQQLRSIVGARMFASLADAARERGISVDIVDRMQPWAAALLIGMPAAENGRFLDVEIYLAAQAKGRQTVGLETAAEQLAVFQAMPRSMQFELLDDTIKNAARLPKQLEELTRVYLDGDAARLEQLAGRQFADLSPAARTWLQDKLVHERNQRMLDRLMPLLSQGSVLVAVGAMHLGGDNGLLAGLEQHGYRVRPWLE
jgi:uncharacterized protein YbaP (TraB family)